jgi:hypothetical protein
MAKIHKAIQLNPADNVVVCTESLDAGKEILISDELVALKTKVDIGHKLACKKIQKGDLIIKYGVPIGTATHDISFGEHVHTHNMKSNYIATYLIDQ